MIQVGSHDGDGCFCQRRVLEVRNLLREKPANIEPTEPTYEIDIKRETEAQKRNRDIRNQEKKINMEK